VKTTALVTAWLGAVVLANVSILWWGPASSVYTAFALIGLTLTVRDSLHDAWDHRGLSWRMAALIGAGSLLSWITQPATGRIVIGSVVAFAASEAADALVYHRTRSTHRSNVVGAAMDSLLFPAIAFGGWFPWITLGQFAAKVGGGALWNLVLRRRHA